MPLRSHRLKCYGFGSVPDRGKKRNNCVLSPGSQTELSMKRREFLKNSALGISALAVSSGLSRKSFASVGNSRSIKKLLVLGMDGMDPALLRRFVAEGVMPNFKKLIDQGYFSTLETTIPPQSPVAWSSFMTGMRPGGHGIYDFVARDPKTLSPHLSTSRSYDAKRVLELGKWLLPLESGKVELLRHGVPYWSHLSRNGIPATVFQIPAIFPVMDYSDRNVRAISGMGTPDLLGTYGSYTYFSEEPLPSHAIESGGRAERVRMKDHKVTLKLKGPGNSFRNDHESTFVPVEVVRDASEAVLRISLGEATQLLQQGEWSDWLPLDFTLLPVVASAQGMTRVYVKSVHPLTLYFTPINIDPLSPALPICTPENYSKELGDAIGRFYTQGLPADTKGLSHGVLSDDDYLAQAKIVLAENFAALDHELSNFDDGCLFFYFSSLDQNSHMLMRCFDPAHTLYNPNSTPEVKNAIRYFYTKMDDVLGRAFTKIDSKTGLIVLSDHGFSTFTREFHLNTWLEREGFVSLDRSYAGVENGTFNHVDWGKTGAYGVGLNCLYINKRGRDRFGSVEGKQIDEIKAAIMKKLPEVKDPETGASIVQRCFDGDEVYNGPYRSVAPDIVVGYRPGYRVSDESVLGGFPNHLTSPRTDKWSADHCMDPANVPGVLLSNLRPSTKTGQGPAIWDLAPTILNLFGVTPPPEMEGKVIFEA